MRIFQSMPVGADSEKWWGDTALFDDSLVDTVSGSRQRREDRTAGRQNREPTVPSG